MSNNRDLFLQTVVLVNFYCARSYVQCMSPGHKNRHWLFQIKFINERTIREGHRLTRIFFDVVTHIDWPRVFFFFWHSLMAKDWRRRMRNACFRYRLQSVCLAIYFVIDLLNVYIHIYNTYILGIYGICFLLWLMNRGNLFEKEQTKNITRISRTYDRSLCVLHTNCFDKIKPQSNKMYFFLLSNWITEMR